MTVILWLIGASLIVAVVGLVVFFWSVRSGQYDDLKGASLRILFDEDIPAPSASGVAARAPASAREAHRRIPN